MAESSFWATTNPSVTQVATYIAQAEAAQAAAEAAQAAAETAQASAEAALAAIGDLDSLTDVVITSVSSGEVIKYDGSNFVNVALAASDIQSGTFADARIAESNVTQHQAALSIATSQLTGTLSDATVAESNVTQHQAALSITESQISDLGAYITDVVSDTTPQLGGDLDAQGNNLTNVGNIIFKSGAGGGTIETGTTAADLFKIRIYDNLASSYETIMEGDAGNPPRFQILVDRIEFEDKTDNTKIFKLDASGITTSTTRTLTIPDSDGTIALVGHTHAASDITSGTFADARISQSSVTQHEAALSITESQISDLGSYAALSGATFTGNVNLSDNQLIRALLKDCHEVTNAKGSVSGAQTIDITDGNVVTATATGAITWTFSNPIASDDTTGFTLKLTNGGAGAQTWPAGVDWPGGTAPTLQASGVDILVFVTMDGGTTWHGALSQSNSS